MKTKYPGGIISVFLGVFLLSAPASAQLTPCQNTGNVRCNGTQAGDYASLASALSSAPQGTIIKFRKSSVPYTGSGNRNVIVSLPVTITSEYGNPDDVVIDLGGVRQTRFLVISQGNTTSTINFEISHLTIKNGFIDNLCNPLPCPPVNDSGGAILIYNVKTGVVIQNNIFINNYAYTGGAVALRPTVITNNHRDVTLRQNIFYLNRATPFGGAVAFMPQQTNLFSLNIESNHFENNVALRGQGEAIYVGEQNLNSGNTSIFKNTIKANGTVPNPGQCIYIENIRQSFIYDNFIQDNIAPGYGWGMIVYLVGANDTHYFYHNTLANNYHPSGLQAGSVIETRTGKFPGNNILGIENNIFWDIAPTHNTNQLLNITSASTTVSVNNNNIQAGFTGGSGNYSTSPGFIKNPSSSTSLNGDYHIKATSLNRNSRPVVSLPSIGAPADDIDGNPRPTASGALVDVGADQFGLIHYYRGLNGLLKGVSGTTVDLVWIDTPQRTGTPYLSDMKLTTPVQIPGIIGNLWLTGTIVPLAPFTTSINGEAFMPITIPPGSVGTIYSKIVAQNPFEFSNLSKLNMQ